jgi:hypothetical protein
MVLLAAVAVVASGCRDRAAEMFTVGACVDFGVESLRGAIVVKDCAVPHTHRVIQLTPNGGECDERADVQYELPPEGAGGRPRSLCLVAED